MASRASLTGKNLDLLNIVLMLLSAIAALYFPFELFLFVYAVLGPLHYLTEINWLHDRQYFLARKKDYLFLVVLIVCLVPAFLMKQGTVIALLLFISFFGSLALSRSSGRQLWSSLGLVAVAGIAFAWLAAPHFRMVFSVFLPSIIHVFIFTGLFLLLGALRKGDGYGIPAFFVFMGCAAGLLVIPTDGIYEKLDAYVSDSYGIFRNLNVTLISLFKFFHFPEIKTDLGATRDELVFFSDAGTKVMRFIAFAYCYHYLNWFSKTSIIQWHRTTRRKLFAILLLWAASVGLYIYDYNFGLRWLYILSMGHVILEFPLNHKSCLEIGKLLKSRIIPNKNLP